MQRGLQLKVREEMLVQMDQRVLWVHREPQEPLEQLETLETLEILEWLDLQEQQDGLASRVRQECKGLLDRRARQE